MNGYGVEFVVWALIYKLTTFPLKVFVRVFEKTRKFDQRWVTQALIGLPFLALSLYAFYRAVIAGYRLLWVYFGS